MLSGMTVLPGTYPQSLAASAASKPNWKKNIGVLSFLLVIICGISLHFFGLAEKNAWFDEAHTLRNLAPVDIKQLKNRAFSAATLEAQLRPTFDIKGLWQTCDNTRKCSDQVPLYYLIARCFCPFFEDSLFGARLLSAILSILITPIFYLWVKDFTQSKRTALIGALIISVSPFLMIYSSEARGYTLWVVMLIITNFLCWQMDRRSGWKSAVNYGCVLCALIMTHLASLLIVPGHALFMLLQGVRKRVVFLSSLPLISAIAIWSVFQGHMDDAFSRVTSTGWMSEQRPIGLYVERLSGTIARAFYDDGGPVAAYLLMLIPIGFVISGFLVKTSVRQRIFLLALLSYPLTLIALDLTLGGVRALQLRYQAPALVLLLLETALVIGALLSSSSKAKRVLGGSLLALITLAGLRSEILIARKPDIWIKQSHIDLSQASKFMEDKKHPLFLSPSFEIAIIASKKLPERARFAVPLWKGVEVPPNTDGIRILNCHRLENGKVNLVVSKILRKLYPNILITIQND